MMLHEWFWDLYMTTIAYIHDGTSVYDSIFLKQLSSENTVYFLTFNGNPEFAPKQATLVRMPGLFSTVMLGMIEGLLMYAIAPLRALVLRLYLALVKPQIALGCMVTKYGFYVALSGFKPFILIIWGSDILLAPKRLFPSRLVVKLTLRRADAVIVDSEVQKEAALQLGCNPERILKFPWFDPKNVHAAHLLASKADIRKRLGWTENPIVINTRSHEPIYGVEYFVEAIPEVINKLPEARFLILGEGHLSAKLKEKVKELRVEDYVKFLGMLPREDTIAYVNAADLYVSTSLSDGTSASLLEAMTLGLPPLVTAIPGNMEWIRDGWNGYLVGIRDPHMLAEKITVLLNDKDLRYKLGKNAQETIETRVDWQESSRAFSDLIFKLAKD
jgi:glycosyltransferase involved in cell wall biosynthesis